MGHIVEQIAHLSTVERKEIILVTSGSVGTGRQKLRRQALMQMPLSSHVGDRSAHKVRDLRLVIHILWFDCDVFSHLSFFLSFSSMLSSPLMCERACAAAGQSRLMSLYDSMFGQKYMETSQVLVTESDFTSPDRRKQLRQTLEGLISYKVIPVINENDVISDRKVPVRDGNNRIFW